MKDYLKFLKKLPKPLRLKLIVAIEKIFTNKLGNLEVKCISNEHQLFRCRIGKIRIVFQKRTDDNYILDIGFRGGVYKNMDKHL